jgi:hypothetical protein
MGSTSEGHPRTNLHLLHSVTSRGPKVCIILCTLTHAHTFLAEEKAYPVNSVEHLTIPLVRSVSTTLDKFGATRASVLDAKLYMSRWVGDASIKEKAQRRLKLTSLSTALEDLKAPAPAPPAQFADDDDD